MQDAIFVILIGLMMLAFYFKGYQDGTRKMADFSINALKEIKEEIHRIK